MNNNKQLPYTQCLICHFIVISLAIISGFVAGYLIFAAKNYPQYQQLKLHTLKKIDEQSRLAIESFDHYQYVAVCYLNTA